MEKYFTRRNYKGKENILDYIVTNFDKVKNKNKDPWVKSDNQLIYAKINLDKMK